MIETAALAWIHSLSGTAAQNWVYSDDNVHSFTIVSSYIFGIYYL